MGFDASPRVHREAVVLVGQHVRGISLFDEAPGDEGAQDALASAGMHLSNGCLIGFAGRVKTKCRRAKIDLNWRRRICTGRVCCHFEYTVNDADVEMHMGVQAGAEPVNRGYRTDAQCCRVNCGSTRAVRDQAVLPAAA